MARISHATLTGPGAPVTAREAPSSPNLPLGSIHDAVQQVANLRQILEDDKQRIGCFLGAGCPLGIYDEQGEKSLDLIPDIHALTFKVVSDIVSFEKADSTGRTFRDAWDSLCKECRGCREPHACTECTPCKFSKDRAPSLEDVLSELRTLSARKGNTELLGMTKERMLELDDII